MKYRIVSVTAFRSKWRAEFRMADECGVRSGKRIRRVIDADSEEAAWAAAEAMAYDLALEGSDSMESLLDAFVATLDRREIGKNTRDGYRTAAMRARRYFQEHPVSCAAFGKEEAAGYVAARREQNGAANSILHEVSVLRLALGDKGLDDPFRGAGIPKAEARGLGRDEERRVLEILDRIEGRGALIAWLAYGFGLRSGEIAALHSDDMDGDHSTARIRNSVRHDGVMARSAYPRIARCGERTLAKMRAFEAAGVIGEGYVVGYGEGHANPDVITRRWTAIARAYGAHATLSDLRRIGEGGARCI